MVEKGKLDFHTVHSEFAFHLRNARIKRDVILNFLFQILRRTLH